MPQMNITTFHTNITRTIWPQIICMSTTYIQVFSKHVALLYYQHKFVTVKGGARFVQQCTKVSRSNTRNLDNWKSRNVYLMMGMAV